MNLTPFLLFEGNCAEAMDFYQSCLGGELTIVRLGDTPC
jgi:PhnB protein